MPGDLSSNWKKLQAKNQAESTKKPDRKRKTSDPSHVTHAHKPGTLPLDRHDKRRRLKEPVLKGPGSSNAMGVTGSSVVDADPSPRTRPSAALLSRDSEVTSEDLADTYGLGLDTLLSSEKERTNEGLAHGRSLGKYVAMDCEMVGVGEGGEESSLARVSMVDFHGRQVYDSFVRPKEKVTDWRTSVSGISPREMKLARNFDHVQAEVAEVLSGRILVGHDLKHDLGALLLSHPAKDIRDTSKFPAFRQYGSGRKPALKTLAHEILGVEIQSGAHSSIEDARVAMALFRRFKPSFDLDNANRFSTKSPGQTAKAPRAKPKKGKKTKRKRR